MRLLPRVFLAACEALFLVSCLKAPSQPGLNYDQCWDMLMAMKMAQGAPYAADPSFAGITGFNRYLPAVVASVSVKTAYLLVPLVKLFGASVTLVRVFTALCGAAALAAAWYCARALFGPAVAVTSVFLLATDPSFMLYTRLSGNYTVILAGLAAFGLGLLVRWHATGRARYWYAGCFVLGCGADIYLPFWGFLAGLALAFLAVRPRVALSVNRAVKGTLAFLAGMPFYLYFYWATKFWLPKVYAQRYVSAVTGNETAQQDFLLTWLRHAAKVGEDFFNLIVQYPGLAPSGLAGHWQQGKAVVYACVVAALASYAAYRMITRRADGRQRRICGVSLVLAGIVASAAGYVHSGGYPHLVTAMPFVHMLMAVALVTAWQSGIRRGRRRVFAAAAIGCAAVFTGMQGVGMRDAIFNWRHASRLGHGFALSPALYELAAYVQEQHPGSVWSVGWGTAHQLPVVTQGAVWPREMRFRDVTDPAEIRARYERIVAPGTWYVFALRAGYDEWLYPSVFFEVVQRRGLTAQLRRRIMLPGTGRPAYEVYYLDTVR